MTPPSPLPLYEEILLLSLDDDKGTTTRAGAMCANAMGGAILAELVAAGAVRLANDKNKTAFPLPTARVDDPILAEAWQQIRGDNKPKTAQDWVLKFAGLKDLKKRAARQLVAKGVLKEETDAVLKIFKRTVFPEADPGPEQELIARLERAIFTETTDLDERTVIVVAMAEASGLLPGVFAQDKLKKRKARLERLASGQVVGAVTKDAMEAIATATMVCTILPIITAD